MRRNLQASALALVLVASVAPASAVGRLPPAGQDPWSSRQARIHSLPAMVPAGRNPHTPGVKARLKMWGANRSPSIQAEAGPGCPHNEMASDGNPVNGRNWITSANQYHTPDNGGACPTFPYTGTIDSFIGYYYTLDGGRTWNGGNFFGPYPDFSDLLPRGDPSVTFDSSGNAIFTELAWNNTFTNGGVYARWSSDGGVTWNGPNVVTDDNSLDVFNDKEWVAADKSPSSPYRDRVYTCWSRFDFTGGLFNGSPINVAYSTDHGASWSPRIDLTTGHGAGEQYNTFCNIAIASNGWVYVVFDVYPDSSDYSILYHDMARSTDGGMTWSAPWRTDNGDAVVITGALGDDGNQYLAANAEGTLCFRHDDYAVIQVDPANASRLYKVWSDGRWDTSVEPLNCMNTDTTGYRHADIAFNSSTDGGQTWSLPVRLNDDSQGNGVDQFQPWMTASSGSQETVTWLDRRQQSTARANDPANVAYNAESTNSSDGGLLWSANQRVSDEDSYPDQILYCGGLCAFLGDYQSVSSNHQAKLAAWTDMRADLSEYGCDLCLQEQFISVQKSKR